MSDAPARKWDVFIHPIRSPASPRPPEPVKCVHLPHEELETCDGRLDRTLDVVHERFGEGVLTRARHLDAELRSGR